MRGWQIVMLRLEDPENYGKKKVKKIRKSAREKEQEKEKLRRQQESEHSEAEAEAEAMTASDPLSQSTDISTRSDGQGKVGDGVVVADNEVYTSDELARVTLEADRLATSHIGAVLFPLVIGFALRTLIMDKHGSWYSWVITTLTGCV